MWRTACCGDGTLVYLSDEKSTGEISGGNMTSQAVLNALSSSDSPTAERYLRREAAKRSAPATTHYNLGPLLTLASARYAAVAFPIADDRAIAGIGFILQGDIAEGSFPSGRR